MKFENKKHINDVGFDEIVKFLNEQKAVMDYAGLNQLMHSFGIDTDFIIDLMRLIFNFQRVGLEIGPLDEVELEHGATGE